MTKKTDVDRQREWARWYERACAAYLEEQRRRGGKEIPWYELPLIPPPKGDV
jgi:hypothetical protein